MVSPLLAKWRTSKIRNSNWLGLGIVILLGLVPNLAFPEGFPCLLLLMVACLYIVAPLTIIMLVLVIVSYWLKGLAPVIKSMALLWCALVASITLSASIDGAVVSWEIAAARQYVTNAVPVLDSIKSKSGQYPNVLPIDKLGDPPRLLQTPDGYTTSGTDYIFQYWVPSSMMDGYQFSSNDRTWRPAAD